MSAEDIQNATKVQSLGAGADVDGIELLNDVQAFLERFVSYPSDDCLTAHALWVAHAHLMGAWDATPRLAFLSPEPASGKSRALEITELLVPRPVLAVNVSSAYLFRKVASDDGRPTILFDEIDTVFGPKAKENEEIRGLLNAGHRKGAEAGRCVVRGEVVGTEEIPAYCAVALAGLGDLPDTILTRSVIVRMRRQAPHERAESYRQRQHGAEGHRLRDKLEVWAGVVEAQVTGTYPDMPVQVQDRDADVWEPLIAVADAAGGDWPEQARMAAVSLVSKSKSSSPSLGIQLLADIRKVFPDQDAVFTDDLLKSLHELDESPWDDLRGKPMDARGLANRLKAYEVHSRQVRIGEQTRKGYQRADLHDVWLRYLPAPSHVSETSETKESPSGNVSHVSHVSHHPETHYG